MSSVVKTFGMELEFYSEDYNYETAGTQLTEYPVVCCKDDSLENGSWQTSEIAKASNGIEVKSDGGQHIEELDTQLTYFTDISNHPTLKPTFNEEGWGTTGFHIHFGFDKDFKLSHMDYIRLCVNAAKKDRKLRLLSGRKSNRWSRGTTPYVNYIKKSIEEANEIDLTQWTLERYHGVNVYNMYGEMRTIEFRFANADIVRDPSRFREYINECIQLLDDSILGENSTPVKVNRRIELTCESVASRHSLSVKNNLNTVINKIHGIPGW